MARQVIDTRLISREARLKLKPRDKRYWRLIEPNISLGYRRLANRAGTWAVRRYAGDGKYTVEGIGTAADFTDADGDQFLSFKQAQDKVRERPAGGESAGPYTVNRAMDDYVAYLRSDGRSAAAIKDAETRINAFIRPTLGKLEVSALKAEQLRQWRADLAGAAPRLRTKTGEKQQHRGATSERARKASANRILTVLKAALNHAFDDEKVASNKAWGRRVKPFENVETARIRYLQVDEAKRLINACDESFRPMVQAALCCGARYSELARLRVSDFDREAGTVFIERSKSGKARHVALSGEAVAFFRQACAGKAGDALIFTKASGGAWLKSHQFRPMADACKRAKIKPAIGFHGLRHTYASLSVKSGAPLHAVALALGHVSKDGQPDVRMVTRHYAHFEKTHIAKMIREHAPRFGLKSSNVRTLR